MPMAAAGTITRMCSLIMSLTSPGDGEACQPWFLVCDRYTISCGQGGDRALRHSARGGLGICIISLPTFLPRGVGKTKVSPPKRNLCKYRTRLRCQPYLYHSCFLRKERLNKLLKQESSPYCLRLTATWCAWNWNESRLERGQVLVRGKHGKQPGNIPDIITCLLLNGQYIFHEPALHSINCSNCSLIHSPSEHIREPGLFSHFI